MADLRKRPPEGTLQRRIFIALRDHGSMTAEGLAEHLNCDRAVAHRACQYLLERKRLQQRWVAWQERFVRLGTPVVRPTRRLFFAPAPRAHPPKDLRGKPANCRNHRGAAAFPHWLRMMRKKHGPGWRYVPTAHPLDAWGMPQSVTQFSKGPQ